MSETEKKCTKCGAVKPTDEFYSRGRQCKACKRDWQRAYREKYPTRVNECARRYRQSHRTEIAAQRLSEYRANPLKDKARKAALYALQCGKLVSAVNCDDCGHNFSRYRRECHHESYEEAAWLVVAQLCSKCHGMRHWGEQSA